MPTPSLVLRMAQAAFDRAVSASSPPIEWDDLDPALQQVFIESQQAAVNAMRGFGKGYAVRALAEDEDCMEDGQLMLWASRGTISRRCFAEALALWVSCHRIDVTIDHASVVFNATPDVIRAAVEAHLWMYLDGDTIEMDGQ